MATLGTGGRGLLVLTELPGAPPARGHTGLYHFALLVPERNDLARWLAHAARDRVALVGLSDHFVSEALYLRDPDHHGIEIYCGPPARDLGGPGRRAHDDRAAGRREPAGRARRPGSPSRSTGCRAAPPWDTCTCRWPTSTAPSRFYRDLLGFGLMAQLGEQRRLPGGRRLPPPPRREHLGEPRRLTAAGRHRRPAPRDDRPAGRRRPRPRARPFRAGGQRRGKRRTRPRRDRPVRQPAGADDRVSWAARRCSAVTGA